MRIPVIKGTIDRRILVNYRMDPSIIAKFLPSPFKPQLVNGFGIAGVCLIRLKDVRPKALPCTPGISSENAAHRFAVTWEKNGVKRCGVYIPRRDTDSLLNHLAGGRIFPGTHSLADFESVEENGSYFVGLRSKDGETEMSIRGRVTDRLPDNSIFDSLEASSKFFEDGSVGYSPSCESGCFDGLELRSQNWKVQALEISEASSSFFETFPPGSIALDHALLMHDIEHEWHDSGRF